MADPSDDTEAGRVEREDEDVRERLEREADRARSEFDRGIVDVLSWLLDTETRARIYVYLRQHPRSTSKEVADGTGLYPSTVREALAELAEEDTVERRKREDEGAGNNPFEYTAIPPSELVTGVVGRVQDELTTVLNLDEMLGRGASGEESREVRIEVDSGSSAEAEVGETEADVETDLGGRAEVDEEGASVEGEAGADVEVETGETEAEVEGNVDAEVGTDRVDVDAEVNVETPADESADASDGAADADEEQ